MLRKFEIVPLKPLGLLTSFWPCLKSDFPFLHKFPLFHDLEFTEFNKAFLLASIINLNDMIINQFITYHLIAIRLS